MNIQCLSPNTLGDHEVSCWSQWQAADRALSSPLFRPELVQAVARHRPGVEVAVIRQGEETVGFFPYHRQGRVAEPFAGTLTDLQGLIRKPGTSLDAPTMLRACGLKGWRFTNLLVEQSELEPYHMLLNECPYMDLSGGFEAYQAERQQARSDELREALRKGRKIQREIGPLRFEAATQDPVVLETLLRWKREQLERMRVFNPLAQPWMSELFADLSHVDGDAFGGMLSALYVNDTLLAAAMCIRSEHVLHGWLTAFNRDYRKFSPGLLLLVELAKAAETLGIERIDMGKGPEGYKKSFRSGSIAIAEGVVELRPWQAALRRAWLSTREWVKASRWGRQAKRMVDRFRYGPQR